MQNYLNQCKLAAHIVFIFASTIKKTEVSMIDDLEDENSYDEPEYENDYNSYEDEPGWGSYEEYGGYNGYDDFTIDEAFDGDPEATWNID